MSDRKKKERSISFVDAATGLTLVSVILYALGLEYWRAYFSFFGIPTNIGDLSFQSVIATTWPVAFLIFAVSVVIFGDFVQEISEVGEPKVKTPTVLAACSGVVCVALGILRPPISIIVTVIVIFLINAFLITIGRNKEPYDFRRGLIRSWSVRLTVLLLSFVGLVWGYQFLGDKAARMLADGVSDRLVSIEVKDGLQPAPNSIFVGKIGENYLLVKSGFDPKVDPVVLIPVANVASITWLPRR